MRPPLGCFNLHASLLPRWRGAAPINRAIMAGDAETGVMVMKMDVGLDTGDVAMAERLAITDAMTAADLHDALAPLGADLMVRAMGALERGKLQLTKQSDDGVTYAAKIEKAEARIDWNRPAREVLRHIHGLSPFPGAWCEMAIDGEQVRVKILRCELAEGSGAPGDLLDDRLAIACGDGAIRILELQRAGKAADEGGRLSARHPAEAADAAGLMPRYKLIIEYDGSAVLRLAAAGQRRFGAGRAGRRGRRRSAASRFACTAPAAPMPACMRWGRSRIAISPSISCRAGFATALNAHLRPHPIGVLSAEIVPDTFEARFSAKKRHYLYRIINRRANLALDIGQVWRLPRPLDTDAMHEAAQRLVGKHDFTTFRDTECQAKSPEKTLDQLDVIRDGDAVNIITSARSFLHSQVRSMVGSLVWVGEGRWSADDLQKALDARSRAACGPVAPPDGLYLVRVDY